MSRKSSDILRITFLSFRYDTRIFRYRFRFVTFRECSFAFRYASEILVSSSLQSLAPLHPIISILFLARGEGVQYWNYRAVSRANSVAEENSGR